MFSFMHPRAAAMLASAAVNTPDVVRRKAAEVVSRPEYRLDQGLDSQTQSLFMQILLLLLRPFLWFMESLQGLPGPLRVLVVITLTLIMLALIAHIVWSFVTALRGSRYDRLSHVTVRDRAPDPRQLETSADQAAADGKYLDAVRFLFKAALARIELAEDRKLRVGITNRELLRRYQKSPLSGPLARLAEVIDRKWYGTETCESADYADCRTQHSSLCQLLQRSNHAVGP
ncbi:MAG: hypothetical protein R3C59_14330 [Planctomycetaceae bacterium]